MIYIRKIWRRKFIALYWIIGSSIVLYLGITIENSTPIFFISMYYFISIIVLFAVYGCLEIVHIYLFKERDKWNGTIPNIDYHHYHPTNCRRNANQRIIIKKMSKKNNLILLKENRKLFNRIYVVGGEHIWC